MSVTRVFTGLARGTLGTCYQQLLVTRSIRVLYKQHIKSQHTIIDCSNRRTSDYCSSDQESKFTTNRFTSTMSGTKQEQIKTLVTIEEAKRFIIDCFLSTSTPLEHAKAMADLLVEADYRGHFSHGMNRLEMYINDLNIKSCDGSAVPEILKETPATAWVDGRNALGAVTGNFCMELAMKKAKTCGVGWVAAKGCNHFGIAGWYTLLAQKNGLIGFSFTNTSPLMSPTRSTKAALGTNPISMAAPANDGDSFVLDMATTAVALGKVEMQRRKNEPLPAGWAQDQSGKSTTDANLAYETGCLMPLGGSEINSGYKGYGLGAMVDILCGIMGGSNFSTHVRQWTQAGSETPADLGQCFIAIDPECFAPGFQDRNTEFLGILRNMPAADPSNPVLVAGDPERLHMQKVDADGGIRYHENQIKSNIDFAKKIGVAPMKTVE